jgi:pimeloyl-CoA synthetase
MQKEQLKQTIKHYMEKEFPGFKCVEDENFVKIHVKELTSDSIHLVMSLDLKTKGMTKVKRSGNGLTVIFNL